MSILPKANMLLPLPRLKSLYLHRLLPVIIALVLFAGEGYGQYTVYYATYGSSLGTPGTGGGTATITGTANLNDAIYTNSATISLASAAPLSGGAASSGYIQMNFTGAVTPTSSNPILLGIQAVNNSLGLTNPLTQVTIQAYNGATPVGSSVLLSTLTVAATNVYVFVPSGNCNAIRISATSATAGLAAATTTVDVYYAYVYDPTCNPPTYTSTNITGVALGASVTNPNNAIDNNIATPSVLSFGAAGVGATIYQNVYYPTLSAAGDVATVTMAIPPAALAVGLLGNITITTYNGSTSTGTVSYGALLQGTDLLTLLQAGATASISFVPTAPFNRVEISMASVLSVAGSLNLYEVAVTSAKPTTSTDTVYTCYGTQAVVNTVTAPATNYELRWFTTGAASDQTPLYTGNTYTTAYNVTTDTVVWVAKYRTGCQQGSEKRKIRIRVNPLPTITLGTNPTVCILGTNAILPYTATTNTPTKYSITWSGSYGLSNVTDNTLPANNILINIPVGQTAGVKNGTLTVKNANGCISNPGNSFSVTVKNPPVISPPISISYQ